MDELKGCFWWIIAIIGWFVLWGACMSIGDSTNISPFVILLIIVGIVVVVGGGGWLIFYTLKSVREKKTIEKVNVIKAKFPLAYQHYTKELRRNKSRFSDSISDIEIAKKVITRSLEEWGIEEERIKIEENKRKENAEKSAAIATQCPHGITKWKHKHKSYSHEEIIENEIRQFEEYYKIATEYDEWEKTQSEFSKMCRELGSKLMPRFGYYKYNIPFKKKDDNGELANGEYIVWQFFAGSYCLEEGLDYSNLEYIKNTNRNIEEFKKRKQYYLPSVYKEIKDFIKKIAENNNVSVFLCANNKEWNAINLNHHYCMVEGAPFYDLPESIEVLDPATDALLFEVDVDPYEYPKLKNKHIIIVEAQTDNSHLEEVCKNVIEKNKNIHPLITYISLFKGYDRDEMLKLIEKKNKEIAEEERKKEEGRQLMLKKQEIEDSIKVLPTLVESNNIEQIESKIKYIHDNIDIVTKKSKDEFEQIKVDYKNKKELGIPQKEELLFVNYEIPQIETEDGYYAIIRMPQKGCIVWPYRRRSIARRGFTESDFEKVLKKYLTPNVSVLGDVNILPQDGVRPYEPDIALIYSEKGLNVRIDIEIDEPYAAVTNKPTHYIGCGDDYRDAYLNNLGWIVIRFSEHQVFQQTLECVKYVAEIINSIDNTFDISKLTNLQTLISEKQWSKIECQKMAAERCRQLYLNHEFGRTEESIYNIKDLKLTSFETSILDKVKPAHISRLLHNPSTIEDDYESDNNILYNKTNAFEQDGHIKFDATQHIYTIDGIQYQSVSSVISDVFPEFDTMKWAEVKARERGVPTQKVIEEWDSKGRQSREVGTFMHQQIENFFLEKPINYEYHYTYDGTYVHEDTVIDIYYEIRLFEEFRDEVPVNPFRSEWRIFDRLLKIAGTIDLISKNEDGSYNIYDWKRSSRLNNENRYQRGLGKLVNLEDTPRNHYYLQQNLYKYILEHQYGLRIKEMKLVGLYGSLDVIDVPQMDNEISIIIQML